MPHAERCPHCHFAVPHDMTSCPGCTRIVRGHDDRRTRAVRSRAFRSTLAPARVARGLLHLTTWSGAAVGVAFSARAALTLDAVSRATGSSAYGHASTVAAALAVVAVLSTGVTALAFLAWSWQAERNLPALEIDPGDPAERMLGICWLAPHRTLLAARLSAPELERERGPRLGSPPAPWRRRSISGALRRWPVFWLAAPATLTLAVTVAHDHVSSHTEDRALDARNVAAAVLLVLAARAAHDIVGIVTVAEARRADEVVLAAKHPEHRRSDVRARRVPLA